MIYVVENLTPKVILQLAWNKLNASSDFTARGVMQMASRWILKINKKLQMWYFNSMVVTKLTKKTNKQIVNWWWVLKEVTYRKSSIKPPLSNKPPPLISPPFSVEQS